MTTKYSQQGDVLTFSNTGSAIKSGDVVPMKHIIGVALVDIAASTGVGSLAIDGAHLVPKTAGHAWVNGEKLLWDTSAAEFDYSTAGAAIGDITGAAIAFGAAASADTTGMVKLTPGNCALQPT